jgi:hypothetical protein
LLASNAAVAQTQGFAVDRFDAADRGSDWLAADSLDLRGTLRWAAGVTLDYAHDPLVAYTPDGEVAAHLVERQLYAHLGGALILDDRFRVGLRLPLLIDSAGETVDDGVDVYPAPDGAALGDARLTATARLIGEYRSAFTLAAGLAMFMPSGSSEEYASDGKVRLTPQLAAAGSIGPVEYAARTGIQVRTLSESLGDEPFGTELQFSLAGGRAFWRSASWLASKRSVRRYWAVVGFWIAKRRRSSCSLVDTIGIRTSYLVWGLVLE